MKRIRAALELVAFTTLFAQAASAQLIRPEEIPGLLSRDNRAVQGAAQLRDAAEARRGFFVRSLVPSLLLEGGAETFETGPYPALSQGYGSAEIRLNFFRGGRDWLEAGARDADAEGAMAQASQVRGAELSEARRAYWQLVFLGEEIALLESALLQNTSHLASANKRIQRGLTTTTDRLEFEIQRSQIKEDLESARHLMKQTGIRFRAMLGLSRGHVDVLTLDRAPHEHEDAVREQALPIEDAAAGLPGVAVVRAEARAAQLRSLGQHRWWTPTLDGYAGYYVHTLRERDYLSEALRDDWAVGFRLSLSVDAIPSTMEARSASLRALALENFALQKARSERARFEVAQESMRHEHDLIHESEDRVAQGESYLRQTLGEYDRGLKMLPMSWPQACA